MNRRAFFARLVPVSTAVALPAAVQAAVPVPYTIPTIYCPACGDEMLIATRYGEKATHDAPMVWTCSRCQESWRIAPQRIAAARVAYDDGTRERVPYPDEASYYGHTVGPWDSA